MPTLFPIELSAIKQLRDKFPTVPQKTLANRIVAREFNHESDNVTARTATTGGIRGFYSVYSVIRRYDKAKAIKTTKAA